MKLKMKDKKTLKKKKSLESSKWVIEVSGYSYVNTDRKRGPTLNSGTTNPSNLCLWFSYQPSHLTALVYNPYNFSFHQSQLLNH